MTPETKCNKKVWKVSNKKCSISFDEVDQSTEAGLLLISRLEEKRGLIKHLSKLIEDERDDRYITHELETLLKQRIFGLIQGYEDCNDHNELRKDSLMMLVHGKKNKDYLASQPTLTRLENNIDEGSLYRIEDNLIEDYVQRLSKDTKDITLDIDGTCEETYGQQVFSFFNGYYDCKMYYPLLVHDYPSGQIIGGKLRKGNSNAWKEGPELLEKIIRRIKGRFKDCKIKVRGDAGFGVPAALDKLESLDKEFGNIYYLLGIKSNAVLQKLTSQQYFETVIEWNALGKPKEHLKRYHGLWYKAESWALPRWIVHKTEMGLEGPNQRFIVTNLIGMPEELYKDYGMRGQSENWIGDLKNGMCGDRLSCHRWEANYFRFLLSCYAYNLMNEIRLQAESTQYGVMRLEKMRTKLFKIAVWIKKTARYIHLKLPKNYPHKQIWMSLLTQLE
jgi:hypothetical protein